MKPENDWGDGRRAAVRVFGLLNEQLAALPLDECWPCVEGLLGLIAMRFRASFSNAIEGEEDERLFRQFMMPIRVGWKNGKEESEEQRK